MIYVKAEFLIGKNIYITDKKKMILKFQYFTLKLISVDVTWVISSGVSCGVLLLDK